MLKSLSATASFAGLAVFAHRRVALAGLGGAGGRCGWKLRSHEAGSALAGLATAALLIFCRRW